MEDLINTVVLECQKMFVESSKDTDKERNIEQYGCFPKTAIVRYCNKYSKDPFLGDAIKMWRIGIDSIEPLTDLTVTNTMDPISGMYFFEGAFDFAISRDKQKLAISMRLGMRYGVGISYNIEYRNSGVVLTDRKMLWVT